MQFQFGLRLCGCAVRGCDLPRALLNAAFAALCNTPCAQRAGVPAGSACAGGGVSSHGAVLVWMAVQYGIVSFHAPG
jgi:class 3 adenylate cyclase